MLDFHSTASKKKSEASKKIKQRAVLVHIFFDRENHSQEALEEFKELAVSSGVEVAEIVSVFCRNPTAKYLIGLGKVEEIEAQLQLHKVEIVLFNQILTPSQERNLERYLKCRVLDKTGLILDIFACRARTFEGCLQVELAQLQYLSTRLVRGWTHLERQKGGVGLRGPGETQLELDKRMIGRRIKSIKAQLAKVRSQRNQNRKSRKRSNIPVVSMVGYTNAGKSTLFNVLAQSHVFAEDQLFATLDPTLRRIELPTIGPVILVDTVGFIQDLPHSLVEAFQATLEETKQADLLLHVIDVSSSSRHEMIDAVDAVLHEIKADQVPQLSVYNKLDLIPEREPQVHKNEAGEIDAVWISALKKEGMNLLEQALIGCLGKDQVEHVLNLNAEDGKLRAKLYQSDVVMNETVLEDGSMRLHIKMRRVDYERLRKAYPTLPE